MHQCFNSVPAIDFTIMSICLYSAFAGFILFILLALILVGLGFVFICTFACICAICVDLIQNIQSAARSVPCIQIACSCDVTNFIGTFIYTTHRLHSIATGTNTEHCARIQKRPRTFNTLRSSTTQPFHSVLDREQCIEFVELFLVSVSLHPFSLAAFV